MLVEDQWQTRMELPKDAPLDAWDRIKSQGVTFDNAYCTVPICTPSRATMWTGQHALNIDMWDNTNNAWLHNGLDPEILTVGDMMREQGYYTAFKGKWHVSNVAKTEEGLEPYGFSDVQQWGDMFGGPRQGMMLDHAATFEAMDWINNKGVNMDKPWFLVLSLINPHDIMFMLADESMEPKSGFMRGKQHLAQTMPFFEKKWDLKLPENFKDDLKNHPQGVRHYKEYIDKNYGVIPQDREDWWLKRRNYLLNCMIAADMQFKHIVNTLDENKLWEDTIVIFVGDHGDMNGAHGLQQKGGIHFDEATVVPFTVCMPNGKNNVKSDSLVSLLDLTPTILDFAGLSEEEAKKKYPDLKGHSIKQVVEDPTLDGPRGSAKNPGKGSLIMWDSLGTQDIKWGIETGDTLKNLSGTDYPDEKWIELMKEAGKKFGTPNMKERNYMRCVVDGRYKLVRFFSPDNYSNPNDLDELIKTSDLGLYDLLNDPGELENLANPNHEKYDRSILEKMAKKLHDIVEEEVGEEYSRVDLSLFES